MTGETLLYLLKKHTWCIPSSSETETTASLYEVSKNAASIAVCLYDHSLSEDESNIDVPFLLLGCDVSGIQKFIYNISSTKAARSLKGRSFYVQLLVDSAIRRIRSHTSINAYPAQVVYSSGGKFYMLLPNTVKVIEAIEELQKEFEQELFTEHCGQISMNMAYVPFCFMESPDGLSKVSFDNSENVDLGLLWKALADRLNKAKNQKFKSILTTQTFDPIIVDAGARVCQVTGIESLKCIPINPKDSDKIYVLPIVMKQTLLGQKLKNAKWIESWVDASCADYDIKIFGVNYKLISPNDCIGGIQLHERCLLESFNDTDLTPFISYGAECNVKFYGHKNEMYNRESRVGECMY